MTPRQSEKIWEALYVGKIHVEDLIALEKAGIEISFKPGVLRKQLRQINAAMKLISEPEYLRTPPQTEDSSQ